MNNAQLTPTFEAHADAKKFFVDGKDENGDDTKRLIRLTTACVVVSIPLRNGGVDKVAFMKSNRGKQYRDSRGRKVQSKDGWDNKVEKLAPLYITEREVQEELVRLLGCTATAYQAFRALQV